MPLADRKTCYRFAEFDLDAGRYELRRAGTLLRLEPKILALLFFLVSSRDRAVSKSEILDAVWPGVVVVEGALTRAISLARKALGDGGREQRFIRTVLSRGYRFVAPVEELLPGALAETTNTAPFSDPFVGRSKELSALRGCFAELLAGRGQIALIAGEPGIGKTRLAAELARFAEERAARVLWARCDASAGPALWPWLRSLRELQRGRDLHELDPAVTRLLAEGDGGQALIDPGGARFRLFDGIASELCEAARAAPIVLVLDDLHAADADSLRLFAFLGDAIGAARVLLIGTYRDSEVAPGGPLAGALAEIGRVRAAGPVLRLAGLALADVTPLVERLAPVKASAAWSEALYRRTQGHPLFLRELVHWLDAHGHFAAGGPELAEAAIPDSLRHAIVTRLQALSPGCRELLLAASVLGSEFPLALLAAVARCSEREAASALAEAEARRLLRRVHPQRGPFQFAHDLVRDVVYDGLPAELRFELHRRAAEAFAERLAAGDEECLDDAARHAYAARSERDAEPALELALRAARTAARGFAFERAALHLEHALELLQKSPRAAPALRGELLRALADARYRAGRLPECEGALNAALAAARGAGDALGLAEAAVWMSHQQIGGQALLPIPARVETLREALAGLPAGERGARARVLGQLAAELFWSDDLTEAEAVSREALELARQLGDAVTLWDVLHVRRVFLFGFAHEPEFDACAGELLALARRLASPERELLARIQMRMCAQLARGQADELDAEVAICERLAERLRQPRFRYLLNRARAARALARGDLSGAEAIWQDALRDGLRTARQNAVLSHHSALVVLRRAQGRFGELEQALRVAGPLLPSRGHKASAYALLLAEHGRRAEAQRELERLMARDLAAIRPDSNYRVNLALAAETCAVLGAAAHAEPLYARLAPLAERNVAIETLVSHGCAARVLGLLAATLGRRRDAERHFAAALAFEQRTGARLFEAWVLLDWGAWSLVSGNARGGRERLAAARELARELGASGLERRAEAALGGRTQAESASLPS